MAQAIANKYQSTVYKNWTNLPTKKQEETTPLAYARSWLEDNTDNIQSIKNVVKEEARKQLIDLAAELIVKVMFDAVAGTDTVSTCK